MPRDADSEGPSSSSKKGVSPTPPKFADNERVLCFHGPLIYEGKVLKKEFRENEKEHAYWVHYAGWSKNWDEWVLERRVLKYSEQNLNKQGDLKVAYDESMRAAKAKATGKLPKKKSLGSDTSSVNNMSTTDSRSSTPVLDQKGPKGKPASIKSEPVESESSRRRRRNDFVEAESHYTSKQEVHIMIPEQLKIFLVDDWDSVTRQKRLVNVPPRCTIDQIFEEYLKAKKKSDQNAIDLCEGLEQYFNTMLGPQLLYRFERSQYDQVLKEIAGQPEKEKKKLTEYYGAPHLMRLFTKLGGCLTYTNLDPEGIDTLRKSVEDFLKFMLKNFDKYFSLEDYGVSCPEYQRKPT
ncbi:Mortality factor 4-like protein 1 [Orchesella cincta]|uniref:Mortality factor 4-like protein 1 n=1 Tax=Orchesella cincta TaxID=48709 RepID=A0A1D2NF41_ORCCI|nr:Mortality factor 4-like protein 1 [Orchesella cincta]